jgi:Family of unknown function (DUF6625)
MAAHPDVSWLLLTEQPVPDAPPNVAVQLCEFEDLAKRIRSHFEFEISLERPYKLCDFRPAFGEIFADELTGYDLWGHSDLDLVFGRIRGQLPAAAFEADKILFNGNFSLYRNTAETAGWYRHEVGKVSYRAARGLRVPAGAGPPGAPDRVADPPAEAGAACTGTGRAHGRAVLDPAERVRRPGPSDAVVGPGFAAQDRVTPWSVRAARIPRGRELLPFYMRRVQRWRRRRATRQAAAAGRTTVQVQWVMARSGRRTGCDSVTTARSLSRART